MSPEDRARIARENGAKSQGPVTEEGKLKSARNSMKHGERAEKLSLFAPPHHAALCTEDRNQFYTLVDELRAVYQPANAVEISIIRDIAVARWQILRLDGCLVNQWNLSLVDQAKSPFTVAADMAELEVMARSVDALFTGKSTISKIRHEIDQLQLRVARLERRLKFVRANFAAVPPSARTQPPSPQPVEKTTPAPENEAKTAESTTPEPPVFVNETDPKVLEFYRAEFPNREIVITPPDSVSLGLETGEEAA